MLEGSFVETKTLKPGQEVRKNEGHAGAWPSEHVRDVERS